MSHYHTCPQSFLLEHNVWPRFTKIFYGYDFWRQGFLKFICHFMTHWHSGQDLVEQSLLIIMFMPTPFLLQRSKVLPRGYTSMCVLEVKYFIFPSPLTRQLTRSLAALVRHVHRCESPSNVRPPFRGKVIPLIPMWSYFDISNLLLILFNYTDAGRLCPWVPSTSFKSCEG